MSKNIKNKAVYQKKRSQLNNQSLHYIEAQSKRTLQILNMFQQILFKG